jgi:hypothetical protein
VPCDRRPHRQTAILSLRRPRPKPRRRSSFTTRTIPIPTTSRASTRPKRGIPKERIVGLKCPPKEEITRDEYDRTIADPLRELFSKNGWWQLRAADHPLGRVEKNSIRFIALIRGIPLKIAPVAGYAGDKSIGAPELATHNEACGRFGVGHARHVFAYHLRRAEQRVLSQLRAHRGFSAAGADGRRAARRTDAGDRQAHDHRLGGD